MFSVSPRTFLKNTTFRLAQVYMALFGVSVAILLGFIYWATAGTLARQTDAAIAAEIVGLSEHYRRAGTNGLATVIRDRIARDPRGASVYLLAGPRLAPLVGNLDRWPEAVGDAEGWLRFRLSEPGRDGITPRRVRARQFELAGGLFLLVGRDIREIEAFEDLMIRAIAWGLAITLLLGGVGAAAMARSSARRIEAINQASREIMSGDLSRRIPTRGTGDDFDQLAANLNRMLDQIEMLMAGVRHVSDNIAHDLRTPLTRLRGQLETLKDRAGAAPGERALVEQAVAEADGLLATFNALLRIAQIEAGARRGNFADLDLAAIARDVAELYEPLAQEKSLRLTVGAADPVAFRGDRDLLFQALVNLVDNAVKYTPAGGSVSLAVSAETDGARLVVADSGPGIPPEDRIRALGRFTRLETSRGAPGNGLGLSLVEAVAKLHGGEVFLDDNQPGLKIAVTLPRA